MNYLNEYSTFDNTQELNEAINDHIKRNQYDLNDTDRDVLLMLSRYSVKYNGVAHLKMDTIANAIGKSKRTIQRSIRKLERLNVIERKEFMRWKSGGNGANIYVILPSVTAEMSCREDVDEPTQSTEVSEDSSNETINSKSDNNKYILETAEAIKNAIPAPIYDALSPFFNACDIYRLTGVIYRAKTSKVRVEEYAADYRAVILDVIRRYKFGQIRSLDGYLYASIRKLSRRLFVLGV